MIGVAMIGMVTVVGQSLRTTFLSTLSSGISADFFIQPNSPGSPFSPAAVESLQSLDFVEAATGFRQGEMQVDGEDVKVRLQGRSFRKHLSHKQRSHS